MSVDAGLYPVLAQQMCESRSLLFIVGWRKMKRADNLVGLEFFSFFKGHFQSEKLPSVQPVVFGGKSFASGAYPSPAAAYGYLFSAVPFNKRRIILKKDHLLVSVKLVQFSGRGPPQIMISLEQKFFSRQRPYPLKISGGFLKPKAPRNVPAYDDSVIFAYRFDPVIFETPSMISPLFAEYIHRFFYSFVKGQMQISYRKYLHKSFPISDSSSYIF